MQKTCPAPGGTMALPRCMGARAGCRSRRVALSPVAAIKEIFMPALSSTMTEGKIVCWLKSPGDKITKGESVVVVESDKADMDVESFSEGFLGGIVIGEGGVANVGEPIAYVAESEAELEEAKSKANGGGNGAAPPPPPPPPPAAEATAPEPASKPVTAAAEPKPSAAAPPPPPPPAAAPQKRADGRIIVTPYAKKLAKDLGVDLSTIAGSGPAGRITASDVEGAKSGVSTAVAARAAPAAESSSSAAPVAASKPAEQVAATKVSELLGTTVPFSGMQQAVSKNMVESLKVPEFRVAYTITTDKLDTLAKRLKPKGVTMTALLAKATGVALATHPLLYAACTADASGITYNDSINVALAVSMPDGGLITPVLTKADSTDIYQLSRNWSDLVKRARSKQLAPSEYSTGNFTISNMGMFGADTFDAILPPGTAAILAVAASKPTVTADATGRIGVERQMKVNLTCDHRIVYGTDAAEFMLTLKKVIEDPEQLAF